MSEPTAALQQTPLYSLHQSLGAKLVPFAGYAMPVQYPLGIIKEHLHTRTRAGLFDVSHMGQVRLHGADAAAALETLLPMDIVDLGLNRQRYAFFTNEQGGILDDLMVTRYQDHLFLVVNAACKAQDIAHLQARIGDHCHVEPLPDRALLALQGPEAVSVLAKLAPAVAELTFMTGTQLDIAGIPCAVTRSGYTGEDGFEISVPADRAEALARRLLADDAVAPIGLGARDTLRLEAGLCLYGHDIDETTTPIEAGLTWAISKARRSGGARSGGFPGAAIILDQLAHGVSRRRVGIQPEGRAPVREGAELQDEHGQRIGQVTSGSFSPSMNAPVAMAYVAHSHATPGTPVQALVRGKRLPATVVKLPFVPQRYYRG